MLAVLKGEEANLGTYRGAPSSLDKEPNTVIGNKTGDAPFHDEVILKKSSQFGFQFSVTEVIFVCEPMIQIKF